MSVKNNYVRIEAVKQGMISSSDNEYKILDCQDSALWLKVGSRIVVEEDFIIKGSIQGKDRLYVKEDNILEVLDEDKT